MQTTKAFRGFEIKELTKKGSFEGFVSVYGNVDYDNDIIEPGAFESVKTTRDNKLRIAAYHDTRKFVGQAEYEDTDDGLYLKGQLNLNVSYVPDIYELMKDGTIAEMSVGFRILQGGQKHVEQDDGSYVRHITKAELWEGSLVPFAANPEAQVTGVKSAGEIKTVRQFEQFLKQHGFSNSQAVAIASKGFAGDQGDLEALAGGILKQSEAFTQLLNEGN